MRPRIGITVEVEEARDPRRGEAGRLELAYARAVSEAGGLPIVLVPGVSAEEAMSLLDGWLIPGGRDLDPGLWGEPPHPRAELQHPLRLELERALWQAAPPGLPILGICYGCQFLAAMSGGALEQHLPDRLGHEEHGSGALQTYRVEPGTRLAGLLGGLEAAGASFHHQAVVRTGPGFRIAARHADGTVEAVEAVGERWMIGVQWHPERTPEEPTSRKLFAAFVAAARAYAQCRVPAGSPR